MATAAATVTAWASAVTGARTAGRRRGGACRPRKSARPAQLDEHATVGGVESDEGLVVSVREIVNSDLQVPVIAQTIRRAQVDQGIRSEPCAADIQAIADVSQLAVDVPAAVDRVAQHPVALEAGAAQQVAPGVSVLRVLQGEIESTGPAADKCAVGELQSIQSHPAG